MEKSKPLENLCMWKVISTQDTNGEPPHLKRYTDCKNCDGYNPACVNPLSNYSSHVPIRDLSEDLRSRILEKIMSTRNMVRNRILIADDDPLILDLCRKFTERGFPEKLVETYPDGTSLNKRLQEDVSDLGLVVTDNNMPGMLGRDIIKTYAQTPKFSNTKFILMTGDNPIIAQEALNHGAMTYLLKPFHMDPDYLNAVRKAFA